MSLMASQITSLTIVYPTVYSGPDKKKTIKAPRHWLLRGGVGEGRGLGCVGLGTVTKTPFVNFSLSKTFDLAKSTC